MQNEQRISKPNNRPTSILMQLLQWLTNLELSGSPGKEQDVGNLKTIPIFESSLKREKEMKDQKNKRYEMKTKYQIMKGLALLLLMFVGTMGVMGQTSQTLTQEVCPGVEPYRVDVTAGNIYLWTITGGTLGVDYTISNNAAAATNITWANQLVPKVFNVTFRETVPLSGCYEEVNLTVTVNPLPTVAITNPVAVCSPSTVDLTAAAVTTGSTAGLTFTYWTDAAGTIAYATPTTATAGTYYIKGTTLAGCSDIKPVTVTVNPLPTVAIINPVAVCSPSTVDLTAAAVTTGSSAGLTFTYWTDAAGTIAYATPTTATAGTYYIRGTNLDGCSDIKPVTVTVDPTPTVAITNPAAVCSPSTVDLTAAAITTGSTTGLTFTYWTDAAGTIAYATPATAIAGTYYIKGTTLAGCSDIKPVTVTVDPTPTVVITNPAAVCSPSTIDLTAAAISAGSTAGLTFTYWTDAAGTIAYATPTTATAGTYYIKGTTLAGCSDIKPVTVTVNPLPTVAITNPAAVCSPSTVDLTAAAVTAGSSVGLTFTYWTDAAGTIAYATPATAIAGTYYIKGTNLDGCSDIKPVTVTVDPTPTVVIINPAAVCSPSTVDLTAAAVTTGSTAGLTFTYWTDAAGTIAYATPTTATAGTYYIKGTTLAGCSDIKPVTVTVNPLPIPTITGPSPVCETTTSHVYTTELGMTNYIWAVSSGGTITAGGTTADSNVTVTWNTAGPQTVTVTYTNASGCSGTKVYNVTVEPLPVTSPIWHN